MLNLFNTRLIKCEIELKLNILLFVLYIHYIKLFCLKSSKTTRKAENPFY